ncbi:DnaJ homolog subfamily B member 14 [Linum grandiflorum]
MEANKEEAVRARELAEKKLGLGDYEGARKMALRAQKLYPAIENLSQLIVVCDVHCSAATKLNGTVSDWYAILQIARFSDEAAISKQYKKLALSLHPDKNKYAGAEAAFKLIGEAKMELTDPKKRALFDAKCRGVPGPAAPKVAASHVNSKAAATKPPAASRQNTKGHASKQTQPERTGSVPHKQPQEETFWTCCQSCKVKFQYYEQFRNRVLRCQNCQQHFVAREVVVVVGRSARSAYFGSASHQGVNAQGSGNAAPQSNGGKSAFAGAEVERDGGKATSVSGKPKSKEAKASGIRGYFKPQVKPDEPVAVETGKESAVHMSAAGTPSRASSKKRPNPFQESSGDNEAVAPPSKRSQVEKSAAGSGKQMEKPSTVADGNREQPKQEPESVTEEIPHRKKSRTEGIKASEDEASMSEKQEANDLDSGHETELGQEHIQCPDAEFTDFEKDKNENCFKVNQVWALYDEKDSMPRFYARVKKILSPGFKLLITWLEACPGTKEEECWEDGDLPISCGTFVMGEPEKIGDRLMFSHQMDCRRGKGRGKYVIYPQKGETWALFKDWDINWGSEPDKHKSPYCFVFVEILSDFNEESGIMVALLDKVKRFVSIFQRAGDSFCVKPSELYRFSHRIPSRMMTGTEREGVPVGSFELDTAALPSSLYSHDNIKQAHTEEMSPEGPVVCGLSAGLASDVRFEDNNQDCEDDVEHGDHVSTTPRRSTRGLRNGNGDAADVNAKKRKDPTQTSGSEMESVSNIESQTATPLSSAKFKIEAVKHDFSKEKSAEKFKTGQVWAIFSKEAGRMPKNYAVVKKIEYGASLTLHVAMLESSPHPTGTAIPLTCGTFTEGKATVVVSVHQVSHLVNARPTGKNRYLIWPTEGEIWAVYKNKNSQGEGDGECEIVKVLEEKADSIKVVTLMSMTKRSGFESFYKAPQSRRLKVGEMEIPFKEINRFSHRCAAYYHEDVLNGCWEVDGASVPCQVSDLE